MRRRNSAAWVILCSAVLSTACSDSSDSKNAPAASATDASTSVAKGTVVLRFGVSDGARKSSSLKDPLTGTVYGALWLAEDVTVNGPLDGSTQYAALTVPGVDLRTDKTSTASWTSPELEPNKYIFTGFLDLDNNGAESERPDVGDPATVPLNDKKFDITAGKQIEFVENFDIIFN